MVANGEAGYGDSRYFLAILRDTTYREGRSKDRTARKMVTDLVTDVGLLQSMDVSEIYTRAGYRISASQQ